MNALELESILQHLDGYQGVFAINYIPVLESRGDFLVFNTLCFPCTSGELGHWIALYKSGKNRVEFYDSYGKAPSEYGLNASPYNEWLYSTVQLQNPFTAVCGHHCIWFLASRFSGISYAQIVNMFDPSDTISNDTNVKSYVELLFKCLN